MFLLGAGFGLLLHGVLLEHEYLHVRPLLRGEAELFPRLPYMIAGYLIQALLFCVVFARGYRGGGPWEGARYGALLGLLVLLPAHLVSYALQPFPGKLVALWVVAGLLESLAAGAIVAAILGRRAESPR